MSKIKKLSDIEARKIAAGEVVERPINIVKELIENSLDSGASKISIYLEEGGKKLIRIVDDGCGMSAEDALICFEHHATSKITKVEDLSSLESFGFRGEALSSISSVSNIELITKEEGAEAGTLVKLSGGKFASQAEIATADGTDISVKDLFFNLPARKKFLKKTETEWKQIVHLFQALCLGYDQVHFVLYHDGKQVYNIPVTENLMSRISRIFDHNLAENLMPVKGERPDIGLEMFGLASNHQIFRYNKNQIFIFVNSRWVKNISLSRAITKGYLNVLPEGKFPVAFLFIEISPDEVDINVHPRKEEVSFASSRKVDNCIKDAIKYALESNLSKQLKKDVRIEQSQFPSEAIQQNQFAVSDKVPNVFTPAQHTGMDLDSNFFEDAPSIAPATSKKQHATEAITFDELSVEKKEDRQQSHILSMDSNRDYDLVGQYKKTYILIEKNEGIVFIDQHAAHERVLYEMFASRFEEVATIKLIFPAIVELSSLDMNLIFEHFELLKVHGIQAEIFGPDKVAIQSVPVYLKNVDFTDLLKMMCSWIVEFKGLSTQELSKVLTEKLRAQMACKAAVRAGDILNDEQMVNLLDELDKSGNRFACPHGRPTSWTLNIGELEKKFKRDYK
jgi:DNA mismatch repair protein MutL